MIKIDLIMISRIGLSDGGRETWLYNFLNYIKKTHDDILFNLITLEQSDHSLLTQDNSSLILTHSQYEHKSHKVPYTIGFISNCVKTQLLKRKHADHVIAVGGLNEAISALISYSIRGVKGYKIIWLRTIYTKENGYRLNKFTRPLLLGLEVVLYKYFFDKVITNGEDTAEFYRSFGINCNVIKNAIPLEKWTNLSSAYNKDCLKVGYIGRLSEVKGIDAFLESIKICLEKDNNLNIEFHIVGDGPFRSKCEELAKTYPSKIFLYGAVNNCEVPNILQNLDCCVALTYLTDSLGGGGVSNALIEQMAAEKILICWDNNIFRRVLDDQSAYFVEQGSTKGLANAFLEIMRNRELSLMKAVEAKKKSSDYSIERHVKLFLELIKI